jgi:hypothetical protein
VAPYDKSPSLLDKLVAEVKPEEDSQATFDKVLIPWIEDENEGFLTACFTIRYGN